MTILVTGATGNYGSVALDELKILVPQEDIFALARSEEKAATLRDKGFQVRIATYDDPESLEKAFSGIDRLLFVSSSEVGSRKTQHQHVVDAAKNAGVSYIAYTSFNKADTSTSPLAEEHAYTEEAILASGIAHTFLRNNWYIENDLPVIQAALKTGKLVHAGGDGKAGWVLRSELAKLGARAVSGKFDFPSILEAGNPLITYKQLAEVVESVTGTKLDVVAADVDTASQFLQDNAGMPQNFADMMAGSQSVVKSGSLAVESDDIEQYLGRPFLTVKESLQQLLGK